MPEFINVAVHRSTQPREFMAALRRSFERRQIDPKFHYLSPRQAQKWLSLHNKYSPFATSPGGTEIYDAAFNWAAGNLTGGAVQLISLACGGAGKELRLVKSLRQAGKEIFATVSDISASLVIEGYESLATEKGLSEIRAMTLDLLEAGDLDQILTTGVQDKRVRVVTCFGLFPNVEPLVLASRLAGLAGGDGMLLIGANHVPESDYEQSTRNVLGQYDNAETRDWLSILLSDCGFEPDDGEIRFSLERCATLPELWQIVAYFHLRRPRTIELAGQPLKFATGEKLRLFFSNRFTPNLLRRVLQSNKMKILGEWISAEEMEGVFICTLACP